MAQQKTNQRALIVKFSKALHPAVRESTEKKVRQVFMSNKKEMTAVRMQAFQSTITAVFWLTSTVVLLASSTYALIASITS